MNDQIEKIISLATSYIGMKEYPANSNNVIFNMDYYGYTVYGKAYPWCVTFVWDIFRMAGLGDLFYGGMKTASCSELKSYAVQNGQWVTTGFKRGDLAVLNFSGTNVTEHVGIVEKFDGASITTIDGNTSATSSGSQANGGMVNRRTRILGKGCVVLGAYRPKYAVQIYDAKEIKYYEKNGVQIIEMPVSDFKIEMANNYKKNIGKVGYANANFFATYHEENKKVSLTLPVGHLVCDYGLDPTANKSDFYCDKYCRERGTIVGGKFVFDSSRWSYQNRFQGKALTTLRIKNCEAVINDIVSIQNDYYDYAVTGLPVMLNGEDVSWYNYVKPQGWDGSEIYATWHIFIGLKESKKTIYVMAWKSTKSNMIYSAEAFNKFSALGFVDVIKLDGGGSEILVVDGKTKSSTSENRRINAIITFSKTASGALINPYAIPLVAVTQRTTNKNYVKWLQWELNRHGANLDIDGSFGPKTLAALKAFQKENGLVVDGSCGPATRKALIN